MNFTWTINRCSTMWLTLVWFLLCRSFNQTSKAPRAGGVTQSFILSWLEDEYQIMPWLTNRILDDQHPLISTDCSWIGMPDGIQDATISGMSDATINGISNHWLLLVIWPSAKFLRLQSGLSHPGLLTQRNLKISEAKSLSLSININQFWDI